MSMSDSSRSQQMLTTFLEHCHSDVQVFKFLEQNDGKFISLSNDKKHYEFLFSIKNFTFVLDGNQKILECYFNDAEHEYASIQLNQKQFQIISYALLIFKSGKKIITIDPSKQSPKKQSPKKESPKKESPKKQSLKKRTFNSSYVSPERKVLDLSNPYVKDTTEKNYCYQVAKPFASKSQSDFFFQEQWNYCQSHNKNDNYRNDILGIMDEYKGESFTDINNFLRGKITEENSLWGFPGSLDGLDGQSNIRGTKI